MTAEPPLRAVLILALLGTCLAPACSEAVEQVRIEGTVANSGDATPAEGARVNLSRPTSGQELGLLAFAIADQRGDYVLEWDVVGSCHEGSLLLTCTADGYFTAWLFPDGVAGEGEFSGRVRCTNNVQRMDIQLKPKE